MVQGQVAERCFNVHRSKITNPEQMLHHFLFPFPCPFSFICVLHCTYNGSGSQPWYDYKVFDKLMWIYHQWMGKAIAMPNTLLFFLIMWLDYGDHAQWRYIGSHIVPKYNLFKFHIFIKYNKWNMQHNCLYLLRQWWWAMM